MKTIDIEVTLGYVLAMLVGIALAAAMMFWWSAA